MRGSVRVARAVLASAAAVAMVATLRSEIAARARRRRRIERGEIRELRTVRAKVQDCCVSARFSSPPAPEPLPVVLVHGFGISSSYFVPTAERLATEFHVYAPDLPGHGRSGSPPTPLDVPQLADYLIAWMDVVGLQRACLVGHSMGCQVAVDVAVRYPGRVARLVLIGPTPDPAGRTAAEQFRRLVVGGRYERVSLNKIVVADYVRMGWRLIPELRFMLDDPVEDKLMQVTVPVMLVRGEKDTLVPQRWFDEVARRVRAKRVAVIEGWGHAVNYSAADQLADAVAPFLRSVPEPADGRAMPDLTAS